MRIKINRAKPDCKGLTLSELMIAALILAVVLCVILGIFGNLLALNETNRGFTAAALHAQAIMERIKDTGAYGQLETAVQNGQWDLNSAALSQAPYNFTVLPNESVTAAVVQSGNPVMISLIVSWNERGQRAQSFELRSTFAH